MSEACLCVVDICESNVADSATRCASCALSSVPAASTSMSRDLVSFKAYIATVLGDGSWSVSITFRMVLPGLASMMFQLHFPQSA